MADLAPDPTAEPHPATSDMDAVRTVWFVESGSGERLTGDLGELDARVVAALAAERLVVRSFDADGVLVEDRLVWDYGAPHLTVLADEVTSAEVNL